jgi:hypothetical protein
LLVAGILAPSEALVNAPRVARLAARIERAAHGWGWVVHKPLGG